MRHVSRPVTLPLMKKQSLLLLIVAVALAACGGGSDPEPDAESTQGMSSFETNFAGKDAYPVFASSEVIVGRNRLLVGILNKDDAPIGDRDLGVHLAVFDLLESEQEPVYEIDLEYLETVPGQRGLYVGYVDFSHSGRWGAEVTISGNGIEETVRSAIDVREEGSTPPIGSKAPASRTPTVEDSSLDEISSDPHPDPSFYQLSIDRAVKSGRPTVIVFATPKFCTSAVCGPTLDIVKKASKGFRGVNFIHVEVYSNLDDPNNLKLVPAVKQWGLPSEPWVFVVDDKGKIAAKYEGSVSAGELSKFLESL